MTHYDPFWSTLIRFDPIWFILIQFDPIWSLLIQFDSNLIPFDPIWSSWSNLTHFVQNWSNLIHLIQFDPFDPFWSIDPTWYQIPFLTSDPCPTRRWIQCWSIFVHFDSFQSISIHFDPNNIFLSSDSCSTRRWIQFAWHGYCACQTHYSSKNFWLGWRIFKILHWIFQSRGLYINDNFI